MFAWLVGETCKECGASYYKKDGYNSKFCSYECKCDYDDRKMEKRERKRERKLEKARKREKEQERDKIKSEIESFKVTSKKQIGNKYGVDISFNGKEVNILDNENGKIGHLKEYLSQLKAENSEMENLINDLQREKDAI
jgi:ribosomal protein S25